MSRCYAFSRRSDVDSMSKEDTIATGPLAILVDAIHLPSDATAFGLTSRERLLRTFSQLGIRTIAPADLNELDGDRRVIAVGTSYFYDERLIAAFVDHPDDLVLAAEKPGEERVLIGISASASSISRFLPALRDLDRDLEQCAEIADALDATVVLPTDLVHSFDAKLRKSFPPFIVAAQVDKAHEAHMQIFQASYKGTTDFVTKWIWPVPARLVTSWCADWNIRPNTVTAMSYVFTLLALIAFAQASFTWGLVFAWMMTFLDTVDGKLARVTLNSTKLGDVLDHGLDLIHPPFWWIAWASGLAGPGELFGVFEPWAWVLFVGYIVGRLLEGSFMLAFGQEMFVWRPFDAAFRLVIARRNPNLVILTAGTLAGRPDLGLVWVGIWTLCCILIQCVRLTQAAIEQLGGRPVQPYEG